MQDVRCYIDDLGSGYVCALTKFLDEFLIWSDSARNGLRTYICPSREPMFNSPDDWVIRYPGATRGLIRLNPDGTIGKVELYWRACCDGTIACYLPSLKEREHELSKFIGARLVFID